MRRRVGRGACGRGLRPHVVLLWSSARRWEVREARTPEEKLIIELKSSFNEQGTGRARVAYNTEEEVADHRIKLAKCVDTRSRASRLGSSKDRKPVACSTLAPDLRQRARADIGESNLFKF